MILFNACKGKDRDLMDVYIWKRGMNIKGGLGRIAKNLDVKYDLDDEFDIEKECRVFLDWKGMELESLERKTDMENIIKKNESDIRVLPLIEDKLGLFWMGRKDIDLFHKIWEAFDESLERERSQGLEMQ